MEYDFSRSSERHYRSARLLDEANEMADAAHLYGLAAECGIKAVLIGTGSIPITDKGDPELQEHKQHMNGLLRMLGSLGEGRVWPKYYAMIAGKVECFGSWSVLDRYKEEDSISLGDYDSWKAAAERVEAMYRLAKVEGCV